MELRPGDKVPILFQVDRLVEDGEMVEGQQIFNKRKNKFWIKPLYAEQPKMLACFDGVDSEFHRWRLNIVSMMEKQ